MVDSFRVGECVVEPQLNRIRCGQKTARIEAKAMDVLVYLAGHPNEVLPKERIIQAAWPDVSGDGRCPDPCDFRVAKSL
jgi:DNA-binding winged helix-turn-helix (wHTH) protein